MTPNPGFALLCVTAMSGCTMSIRPPAAPLDPVTVHLVDYGDTSRLWLPASTGTHASREHESWLEWCYGDWEWYAMDHQSIFHGLIVFVVPTPGALGRREHPSSPTNDPAVLSASEVQYAIIVDRCRAEALSQRLECEFRGHASQAHLNTSRGISFVPTDSPYWLGHQSSTVIADWLRELGCQVDGFCLTATFEVLPPTGQRPQGSGRSD